LDRAGFELAEADNANNYALLAKTRTGWESAAKVIAAGIARLVKGRRGGTCAAN
jgi:hypothetical protein